jgi:hypothetical protein
MPYGKKDDTLYSSFNSAAQEISRIHELFLKALSYKEKGDLRNWNYQLDSVWVELAGDKNVQSKDEVDFYKFHDEYAKYKNKNSLTYQILLRKHIFLKRLQDRLGKGTKYQKEDDSGM